MSIELRIQSGARAGQTQSFEKTPITIGRHPESDLWFDPTEDLDVSTRHGEIRAENGRYVVYDCRSTNGTFVNGERLAAGRSRELRNGDVIGFGERGPTASVLIETAPTRVASPEISGTIRMALTGVALVMGGLVALAIWARGRENAEREVALTKAFQEAQSQRDRLMERSLNDADWMSARDANNKAIVLIASEIGTRQYEATGFSVNATGLIVTSRHAIADGGNRAKRIRIKFADTRDWYPAHVVRVHADSNVDLGLLQVDRPGSYPSVSGIASEVDTPTGGTIATLGFPLGTDIPMDGSGGDLAPKTTLTVGTVSKTPTRDVLQIDAYAARGSSGSPVLDARGRVIGVVYGGPKASAGRIVFAVPAPRVNELLSRAK